MAVNTGNGMLEIDLDDFWRYVKDNIPIHLSNNNIFYGVPRINEVNQTMEIDYRFNDEINPTMEGNHDESKEKLQWDELKK